jgi:hypothetical protein
MKKISEKLVIIRGIYGSESKFYFQSCSCSCQNYYYQHYCYFEYYYVYEGITKSIRTGRLEREMQMVQLSATRCSCIVILWVILVSFAAITLCVASQRVFIVVIVVVVIYFVMTWSGNLWIHPSYFPPSSYPLHQFNIAKLLRYFVVHRVRKRSFVPCYKK